MNPCSLTTRNSYVHGFVSGTADLNFLRFRVPVAVKVVSGRLWGTLTLVAVDRASCRRDKSQFAACVPTTDNHETLVNSISDGLRVSNQRESVAFRLVLTPALIQLFPLLLLLLLASLW